MRVALFGMGRMGRRVARVAEERGHEVGLRIEGPADGSRAALAACDIGIDFSVADAVLGNVRRAAEAELPLVIGTTGWYAGLEDARRVVEEAGIPLLWAANFSLGVHLFTRVVREAARLADALDEYDLHLHETHHRHKRDHPSGTALRLAEVILREMRGKEAWLAGPPDGAADPTTLYVTSARVGEAPGTHEVGVDGPDDRIELRHVARSRTGFARGAVMAAEWLVESLPRTGILTIEDWLAERF